MRAKLPKGKKETTVVYDIHDIERREGRVKVVIDMPGDYDHGRKLVQFIADNWMPENHAILGTAMRAPDADGAA